MKQSIRYVELIKFGAHAFKGNLDSTSVCKVKQFSSEEEEDIKEFYMQGETLTPSIVDMAPLDMIVYTYAFNRRHLFQPEWTTDGMRLCIVSAMLISVNSGLNKCTDKCEVCTDVIINGQIGIANTTGTSSTAIFDCTSNTSVTWNIASSHRRYRSIEEIEASFPGVSIPYYIVSVVKRAGVFECGGWLIESQTKTDSSGVPRMHLTIKVSTTKCQKDWTYLERYSHIRDMPAYIALMSCMSVEYGRKLK